MSQPRLLNTQNRILNEADSYLLSVAQLLEINLSGTHSIADIAIAAQNGGVWVRRLTYMANSLPATIGFETPCTLKNAPPPQGRVCVCVCVGRGGGGGGGHSTLDGMSWETLQ